jgi:hypothetical protein
VKFRKEFHGEFKMTGSTGDLISAIKQKVCYVCVHIMIVNYCPTERFILREDYYNTKLIGVNTDVTLGVFMNVMLVIMVA